MKIDRLETHDRLEELIKDQAINISDGASTCLKANPLSLALQEKSPYIYLFAHPRTLGFDEKMNIYARTGGDFSKIPEKVMFWQPRLTKPKAQTNSYLFRAISKTDTIEVCWLLPPEEMWPQYKKGNITEHEIVLWSINQYMNNRANLEAPEPDDLPDDRTKGIYKQVASEMEQDIQRTRLFDNLYLGI